MFWLHDKLRLVERRVKRRTRFREIIPLGKPETEGKYSRVSHLDPQALNGFSAASPPQIRRILAANPQPNPQIFRPFSASFAHRIVLPIFRSLCAAFSQEMTGSAGEKNGEKKAGAAVLRKTALRGARVPRGSSFQPKRKAAAFAAAVQSVARGTISRS